MPLGAWSKDFFVQKPTLDHPMRRLTQNLSFAAVSFLCHGGALLTYYSTTGMLDKVRWAISDQPLRHLTVIVNH
jgi:hypothetical protein